MIQRAHSLKIAFALTAMLSVFACCHKSNKASLLIHAGAGQRYALDEIAEVFQRKNPDIAIDFSYKGSGYFLADLTASREGDIYMPGEEFYVLQAVEKGFISNYNPETEACAWFITVIITPAGNPANITSLEDFARSGVRVGLGDPRSCSIGLWQEKIFKKAGIWEAVRKNASMSARCIPELGNACMLKAIDATVVWATTAALYLKHVEIIPMRPEHRGLVRLPAAVLNFSHYPKETQILKDFILSDEAKKVFHSYAYCIDTNKIDEDVEWLIKAAAIAKDPSAPITEQTVGHLVKEVGRQRKSKM
jgi:molybdate transport system substrate-binding protein